MTDIFLGNQVVGFIRFDIRDKGIYLHWTEIQPEYRQRGISTSAIKALCAKAKEMGLPVIIDFVFAKREGSDYVTTDSARDFYTGLGFREAFRYGKDGEMARVVWQDPNELFDGHVLTPAGAYEYLLGEDNGAK